MSKGEKTKKLWKNPEYKKKMIDAHKLRYINGYINPFKDKQHTEKTKEINRQAHLGKKQSEESNKKRSKTLKKVLQNITHHINGDHSDNRLENLKKMSQSEHMILHNKQGDLNRW